MPRRSILSAAERESLLALPDTKDDLIRHYTAQELRRWVYGGGKVLPGLVSRRDAELRLLAG